MPGGNVNGKGEPTALLETPGVVGVETTADGKLLVATADLKGGGGGKTVGEARVESTIASSPSSPLSKVMISSMT